MKLRHVFLVLLALGFSLTSLADLVEARSGRGGGGRQRGQNLTEEQKQAMKEKRAQQMEARFAPLNLSETQKKQLQTLREKQSTRMQELRAGDQRPSTEEMQKIRQEQEAEIAKILTADQLTKYQELKAQRPERGKASGRRGGQAKGTATEPE